MVLQIQQSRMTSLQWIQDQMNPTSPANQKKKKKWLKDSSKLTVSVVFTSALVVCFIGPYLAIKKCKRILRFINEKRRRYQSLFAKVEAHKSRASRGFRSPRKSFTRQYLELADRNSTTDLRISLAYQKGLSACPDHLKHPLYEYHGPQPPRWPLHQHIRRDEASPSQAVGTILCLGGSHSEPIPAPKTRGCVVYSCLTQLICGDLNMELMPARKGEICLLTDLMRSSRATYENLLHHFYARNLLSFFGPESLLYFVRNVSPEGLQLIRYVHMVLPLHSEGWMTKNSMTLVVKAFEALEKQFHGLKQLDVEVLKWFQPKEPPTRGCLASETGLWKIAWLGKVGYQSRHLQECH